MKTCTYQVCNMVPEQRVKTCTYQVARGSRKSARSRFLTRSARWFAAMRQGVAYTVCKPVCYTKTINCTQLVAKQVPYTVTRCVPKTVASRFGHGLLPGSLLQDVKCCDPAPARAPRWLRQVIDLGGDKLPLHE